MNPKGFLVPRGSTYTGATAAEILRTRRGTPNLSVWEPPGQEGWSGDQNRALHSEAYADDIQRIIVTRLAHHVCNL